jgi:hypothetical protein
MQSVVQFANILEYYIGYVLDVSLRVLEWRFPAPADSPNILHRDCEQCCDSSRKQTRAYIFYVYYVNSNNAKNGRNHDKAYKLLCSKHLSSIRHRTSCIISHTVETESIKF